jgi:hypothetical protein
MYPVRKADNLTAMWADCLNNVRFLTSHTPIGVRGLLKGKSFTFYIKLKLNSMVWVREGTIPTERPPLVGEVIANLCW